MHAAEHPVERAAERNGRPAVFLDRDGTVLVEKDYLSDPDQAELIPGAADALARLAEAGYALVLVTNQSGIARGLFTEREFQAVQSRLEALLRAHGVTLARTYYCPHHPRFTGPCDCRKPAPALFRRAIDELGLDAHASYFVGDRLRDVAAARLLGGTPILVRTGHGAEEEADAPESLVVVDDLAAAAERIVGTA